MINGPDHCELNKMDTLIIALALEVAIREGLQIEEEVEDGEEGMEEEGLKREEIDVEDGEERQSNQDENACMKMEE